MRNAMLSIVLILLLSGCAKVEEMKVGKLAVEPYELSEKETELISKTGVGMIEYFKLNGKVPDGDTLVFSLETYEKGKLIDEEMQSWGDPNQLYEDMIVSFATNAVKNKKDVLNVTMGIPSGIVQSELPNGLSMSTMCSNIDEKVELKKGKPFYLATWKGTNRDGLSCNTNDKGRLPERLKEAEMAHLYKVLWTDEKGAEDR